MRNKLVKILKNGGGLHLLERYWGNKRLTVLAHHRITTPHTAGFFGLDGNVSATPADFEKQIQWVVQNFNVIDVATLRAYVVHGQALPERPLLITFDDGYMDNYENAFPVLKKYGLPAVIFIVTGSMDDPSPLWWDVCAESFERTTKTSADLPFIGQHEFLTDRIKAQTKRKMLNALKAVPEAEKRVAMEQVKIALEVDLPKKPMFFNWEHVQELVANGIACQPHTVNHPILTRIPEADMRQEIAQSRQDILDRSNQEVMAFAYPNGSTADYNLAAMQALRDNHIDLAFTLTNGPMPINEVREHPLQIKRIYLTHFDAFEMFQLKVLGLPALINGGDYN